MEGADRCDRTAALADPGGIPGFQCVRCNEHRIGVPMAQTTAGPICSLCDWFVSFYQPAVTFDPPAPFPSY